jgi:hypothetical protein
MERIPLHSWEMEFSFQYHMTINSQLNDQNSIRYYIKINITVFETIQFKLFPGMIFGFTFLKPARREPIT